MRSWWGRQRAGSGRAHSCPWIALSAGLQGLPVRPRALPAPILSLLALPGLAGPLDASDSGTSLDPSVSLGGPEIRISASLRPWVCGFVLCERRARG